MKKDESFIKHWDYFINIRTNDLAIQLHTHYFFTDT